MTTERTTRDRIYIETDTGHRHLKATVASVDEVARWLESRQPADAKNPVLLSCWSSNHDEPALELLASDAGQIGGPSWKEALGRALANLLDAIRFGDVREVAPRTQAALDSRLAEIHRQVDTEGGLDLEAPCG